MERAFSLLEAYAAVLKRNRSGVASSPLVDSNLPMKPFTQEASQAADSVKDAADQVAGLAGKTGALCARAVEARGLQKLGREISEMNYSDDTLLHIQNTLTIWVIRV